MSRRQYAGGAKETTITGSVASSGAVSIAIADSTGWPDASVGPFAVVIDPGTASEEKVLVTARVGLTLTVTAPNRGYDGTSAIAHSSGAAIYHTFTAVDFDEANEHVNDTSAAHAASAISFAPVGTVAATTVQAAIAEVDSEKAAASHAHATSDITSFTEAVQDVVGAFVAGGSGITATYSDGGNTLTIAASPTPISRWSSASTQAVGAGATTTLSWTTEAEDDLGMLAPTSTTVTVPSGGDGIYAITVRTTVNSSPGSGHFILVHNSLYAYVHKTLDTGSIQGASWVLPLAATDTFTIGLLNATGGSINVTAALLTVAKVGAA